jgi:rhodanese-related sulfurtransferase
MALRARLLNPCPALQDDAKLVDTLLALVGGDRSAPIVTYCYSGGRAGRAEVTMGG